MTNEYPPIIEVDDNGNIVGPIKYDVAHPKNPGTKGVRHLTSNVLVFEDESYKKLLLTERSKGINREGIINISVGGHGIWLLNENRAQTPLETAIIEAQEEIFNRDSLPSGFNMVYLKSFRKDLRLNDPEYVHLFRATFRGPFNPDPIEVSKISFEDLSLVRKDIVDNPDKYVKSAQLYINHFFAST